jgi:hypothetical protein
MKVNVSFKNKEVNLEMGLKNKFVGFVTEQKGEYDEFDIVYLKQTDNIYSTIKSNLGETVYATTQDIVNSINIYQKTDNEHVKEINILIIG